MEKTDKTIGDLTLNQVIAIKDRCHNYSNCKECQEKDKICYRLCQEDFYVFVPRELLDKEIEVEEDEKED